MAGRFYRHRARMYVIHQHSRRINCDNDNNNDNTNNNNNDNGNNDNNNSNKTMEPKIRLSLTSYFLHQRQFCFLDFELQSYHNLLNEIFYV